MHTALIGPGVLLDRLICVRADFVLEEPREGVAHSDEVLSNSNPLLQHLVFCINCRIWHIPFDLTWLQYCILIAAIFRARTSTSQKSWSNYNLTGSYKRMCEDNRGSIITANYRVRWHAPESLIFITNCDSRILFS